MQLTIILPCYNVAPYIERAMKSLLAQALEDYEIIIVDDGSTDGLLKVCEQWQGLPFVKVVHTENQGVSEARNTGLRMAQGDFVYFMDPDDWLEDDVLAKMLKRCRDEEADAIRFNAPTASTVDGPTLLPRFVGYSLKELDAFGTPQFEKDKERSYVWSYIFRKAVLVDNGIQFAKGLHFMEDKLFLCEFFCYAHKIVQINQMYYHYEVRNEGLTNANFRDTYTHASQRLLAERNRIAMAGRMKEKLNIDVEPLFQGTLVLAAIELFVNCFKGRFAKQYELWKEYVSLPSVQKAFREADKSKFCLRLKIGYVVVNCLINKLFKNV